MSAEAIAPARSCGSCRLCCKLFGIAEVEKAPGDWCRHACASGCSIYDARPKTCRDYVCTWLAGTFREEDRPDRSRIVVHVTSPQRWARDGSTGESHDLVELYTAAPGAERTKAGRRILETVLGAGSAAAVHHEGRVTLYFPSRHVSELPLELVAKDFAQWRDPSDA